MEYKTVQNKQCSVWSSLLCGIDKKYPQRSNNLFEQIIQNRWGPHSRSGFYIGFLQRTE
jgi:hypothetical protein